MLDAAAFELGADLRDLGLEIVDQQQAGVDRSAPRFRDLQIVKQPAAGDAEEVGDRQGLPQLISTE